MEEQGRALLSLYWVAPFSHGASWRSPSPLAVQEHELSCFLILPCTSITKHTLKFERRKEDIHFQLEKKIAKIFVFKYHPFKKTLPKKETNHKAMHEECGNSLLDAEAFVGLWVGTVSNRMCIKSLVGSSEYLSV